MSIFFTKVAGVQLKKDPSRDVFLWLCLILQNTFFAKHIWVVTASAKCHSFSLLRRPHYQNATLDLGYVLNIFKYFQSKHCESLVNSCSWKSKTINWFIADKTSNTSKIFLEIRSCRPAVFFKNYVLQNFTSFTRKRLWSHFFIELYVSPHTRNCTYAITAFLRWIYLMEYICSMFHFSRNFSFWTDQISDQINIC